MNFTKKYLKYILLLILVGNFFGTNAQILDLRGPSPYQALNQILNSEFIQRFDKLKGEAENMVKEAKLLDGLHPEEVENLEIAYNTSAEHFNLLLHNIKTILLTKSKRKYYFGNSGNNLNEFHKLIEADLGRAERAFNKTFKKEYLDLVAKSNSDAVKMDAFIGVLSDILNVYLPTVIDLFKKLQSEINKYNETILNDYLIKPHKFQDWSEVGKY